MVPGEAHLDPAVDPPVELSFPDLPRLELEEALAELTDRAAKVLQAQGRLRALLRANALVGSELNLSVVLRHIVQAARELVGARYVALGVLAEDGTLEKFVHLGMDSESVTRIGHLPRGHGLLGYLIRNRCVSTTCRRTRRPSGFPQVTRPCTVSSDCPSASGTRCSATST
jgi:hypothetical protein